MALVDGTATRRARKPAGLDLALAAIAAAHKAAEVRGVPDPEARGRLVALPFGSSAEVCQVRSLRARLEAAGIAEGSVFRRVDRHDHVLGARLSPRAVALVVKRAVAEVSLDAATYAGHSLRAGRPDRDHHAADRAPLARNARSLRARGRGLARQRGRRPTVGAS